MTGYNPITRAYNFDNRGNRVRMVVTGSQTYTVTYSYDLNNRLQQETRTGTRPLVTTYTYDRNGNELTRSTVVYSSPRVQTYNAFNQLTSVTAHGPRVDYTYRADGLRHSRTVNGVTTYYIWNGSHMVLEFRSSDRAVVNRFARCPRGRLIHSEQHGWYLYNNRGDVVQRVNDSGTSIGEYRYSAFGMEVSPNSSNTNPFRFAGEYWDALAQTYYLRARNFDPRIGRFTQPDPHWNTGNMMFGDSPTLRNGRIMPSVHAIMQAGNLYMFTIHDPVNFIDPSGLFLLFLTASVVTGLFLAATAAGALAVDHAMHGSNSLASMAAAGIASAVVNTADTATSIPATRPIVQTIAKDETRSEPIAISRTNDPPRPQQTLFHATSPANAASIMSSGILTGSSLEGGFVYAWRRIPTKRAVGHSGANTNLQEMVLIVFQTTAPFQPDPGINHYYTLKYQPLRSVHPGPIHVSNVVIIPFARR